MKYIVQIKKSEQISPDDWELKTYALEVDRETTVGQIEDWVHKIRQVHETHKQYFRLDAALLKVDKKP
jgi:hypothetical protein